MEEYIPYRLKVQDYARWKPIYEEHDANPKARACKGTQVFRNAENPNKIVIVQERKKEAKK